ncbi:uncharacterized protein LOC111015700 [Momordica charantia]|uniref:Uncharacterized protein LOC111015700 n=1 Tax=Momordica charantia TaxID=3673 RepID=A0A6J1CYB0_MOMCH|nr:uncharacterized protein LOC111015700 [Momordica charantia]
MAKSAPVKVVLIEYHHVQTDVSNFKSVVQSLTGNAKRSSSALPDTSFPAGDTTKRRRRDLDSAAANQTIIQTTATTTPFDLHTMSFKDLDRLLKFNLPSVQDLDWIWADN